MIKVVVVEDEMIVRKGIISTTNWNKYDCEVIGEASNGREGITIVQKLEPDIVITDVRMPGLDGIEMIKQLVQLLDLEYIVISGYSEFEYAKQAVKLGVTDYLLKPVDDEELYQALANAIKRVRNKLRYKKIEEAMDKTNESKIMLFKQYFLDDYTSSKEHYIVEAIKYIRHHWKEDIKIKDVAEHLALSESYLSRLFKKETKYTLIEYLTNYRIQRAIELLQDPNVRIYEVAGLVGYRDSRYFSSIFKKLVGVTPTEFKDKLNI